MKKVILAISILVFALLLFGCTNRVPTADNSTIIPVEKLMTGNTNVKHIGNWIQETTKTEIMSAFSLMDEKLDDITSDGHVVLRIEDKESNTIYTKGYDMLSEEFKYYKNKFTGIKTIRYEIYTKLSDINGTPYKSFVTVTSSRWIFSEHELT